MRNHLQSLLASALFGVGACWAPTTLSGQLLNHAPATICDPETAILPAAPLAPVPVGPPQILAGGGCTNTDVLGSASNMFTLLSNNVNPIACDNATGAMVFIHRNNASVFGGSSGSFRYDYSSNGGVTWTTNQGPLNPTLTFAGRYPSVAIYNPTGNTTPGNAYLSYYAPTITGTTWNGYVSGVRRLNGTGNTETYNQAGTLPSTLIPRSLVQGAPGVMWAVDAINNGTAYSGFRIFKGTWNTNTSDFVWALNTTFTPTFNTAFDATARVSDFSLGFDPSGMHGYMVALSHLSPGPASYAYYPVFYETHDGGVTWSGPTQVDIGQFPCLTAQVVSPNTPALGFELDLAVDVYGDPHALVTFCNGANNYSVYLFTQYTAMVDITRKHGVWNANIIDRIGRGRGTFGTAPNTLTQDYSPQISRSDDGTKIFYLWVDADSSNTNGAVQPDLYGKSYDVVNNLWTDSFDYTSCNVTSAGQIIVPRASANARNIPNGHAVPVVYGEFTTPADDPNVVANFRYLDSIYFVAADYTGPGCVANAVLAPTDTLQGCGTVVLSAPSSDVYLWSNNATTQSITVSSNGWYKVAVRQGCCIGYDSVYVQMVGSPAPQFTPTLGGMTATFQDQSIGNPTQWFWDFGDGSTTTVQNPTHTYTNPGTYTVCLTVSNNCGSNTSCQPVTVSCMPAIPTFGYNASGATVNFTNMTAGSPTSYLWTFGDGNTSTQANPSHTYANSGNYTVCLTITDACGSDTSCTTLNICLPLQAAFNITAGSGPTFGFMDVSAVGAVAWFWDFGDGNTSNVQNPTHTYQAAGTYTVCLTAYSICDTSTLCQTVVNNVNGIEDGLASLISLVPNPAEAEVRLMTGDLPAGPVRIRLHNVLGQTLKRVELTHVGGNLAHSLSLEGIQAGIYFVEVQSDGQSGTKKLVVR